MRGIVRASAAAMIGANLFGLPAVGAGLDPRNYRCGDLQSAISAHGFVFLSQPVFGDFVVAGRSYCSGSAVVQLRSVPTQDNPQCLVNYCVDHGLMGTGSGGGM
jgi:hypothetical protein